MAFIFFLIVLKFHLAYIHAVLLPLLGLFLHTVRIAKGGGKEKGKVGPGMQFGSIVIRHLAALCHCWLSDASNLQLLPRQKFAKRERERERGRGRKKGI